MNSNYQDTLLINDIVERNYYYYFKRGQKSLCLTFYHNNKFNNSNLIPGFPITISDIDDILLNLQRLLHLYIREEFFCDIKINDDLWLTDEDNRDKIIDVFIDVFKDSSRKPQNITINVNAIHCLGNKYQWFETIIKKFAEIGIAVKLNVETMLIDIVDIQYLMQIRPFLLRYACLKVRINPNNLVYFMEIFQSLYEAFEDILYLYEEDNVNWTEYKINEYVEFLNDYINFIFLKQETPQQFLEKLLLDDKLSLISLKDNGTLNNSDARGKCSFYNSLNILVADLTINLCPKFQYDDQTIGQYICNEDGIEKIDPKHLALISMNIHLKKSSTPHCETCPYVVFCQGFCCKESYKFCFNPIIPLRESCELKRAKYAFLLYKLKSFNLITEENFQQISNLHPFYGNYILKLYENITGGLEV